MLTCGILSAQETPAPPSPELRARFGFQGPVIHKLADGIDLLTTAPRDGGGCHVLVHNGRRARIDRLWLDGGVKGDELPAVQENSVPISYEAHGLASGDLDGDGTQELVILDANGRLSAPGQRKALAPIDVGRAMLRGALALGDLDGDGKADAVVLTRDGLVTVLDLAGSPRVSRPDPIQAARVRSFHLADVDGDGKLDAIVATAEESMPLRIRRGRGDGTFGPWLLFDLPNLLDAFPGAGSGERPTLVVITNERRIVEHVLEPVSPQGRALQWTTLADTKQLTLASVHGDYDGDGDPDLLIAEPERARITWLAEQDGQFETRVIPALAGIHSLALGDVDRDGKLDLVCASPEEKTLAWRPGNAAADAFPAAIPVDGTPVAVAVEPDGALLVLVRNEKLQGKLLRLRHGDDGFQPAEDLGDIGRIGSDPHRLLLADLDGAPGRELAFVVRGEGLRVLRGTESGGFTSYPRFEAGFTKKIEDGALELAQHDGQEALAVVRERYVRRLRLDPEGQVLVLGQDNGPAAAGQLDLAARHPDGTSVILDRTANKLYRTAPEQAPISVDVPPIGAFRVLWHGDAALVVGNRGVVRVPFRGGHELKPIRAHERLVEKTNWFRGTAADLDGDGKRELVLLDEHMHGVHVLVTEPEQLARALSFPVFELPDAGDTVFEPRALAAGDVDRDGRQDLILIAHDRVLIYLQEP